MPPSPPQPPLLLTHSMLGSKTLGRTSTGPPSLPVRRPHAARDSRARRREQQRGARRPCERVREGGRRAHQVRDLRGEELQLKRRGCCTSRHAERGLHLQHALGVALGVQDPAHRPRHGSSRQAARKHDLRKAPRPRHPRILGLVALEGNADDGLACQADLHHASPAAVRDDRRHLGQLQHLDLRHPAVHEEPLRALGQVLLCRILEGPHHRNVG
mmetsp:Transcript_451/g.1262  ORF Transcript_451/g.1262 Transcript_451/m.1262 type:complete len:215 (-) Transcript_451:950-1594(-)